MWLVRNMGVVLVVILTSFYFFPFEFVFLPDVNTKMAMAGIGLCVLTVQLARKRESIISRDFFELSLWAGGVSLVSFFAVVFNDTNDYTYATYIVSMWVWTAAAYLVVQAIGKLHGEATVELIMNYLIAVCVAQCLIALSLDLFQPLRHWVSLFYNMGTKLERMSGIGAGLDVAGSRFAAVLTMITYQMIRKSVSLQKMHVGLYMFAFLIISVIGNMISRTTIAGVLLSVCYLMYVYMFRFKDGMKYIAMWFVGLLLVCVPVIVYEYKVNLSFQEHFYFGFEGFFSLIEKGRWEVHSNEILKNMYVFPENLKTWLVGDGYLNNPFYADPYYTGIDWHGYYQNTDVGYLRFIFYFGLLGLIPFCIFMCKVCKVCANYFSMYREAFVMILLLNFIVWFKVSTDIFLVFALFLALIGKNEDKSINEKMFFAPMA